jgi:leader peptidase (prepilin peptidase)/N-methyltransferase
MVLSIDLIVGVWLAALGLVAGSYLNVVIHRLPRGTSTVTGRSACPACGGSIAWYHNVPLFGFLLLRGRCRACGAAISWRYPMVEALGAVAVVLPWVVYGPTPRALAGAVFLLVLLALAGIDREHFILPDRLTYPLLVLALALAVARPQWGFIDGWREAVAGALVGAAIPVALIGAWLLLRGEEGMGWGDVKLLAGIGATLGVAGVLVTIFLASMVGSVVGLVGMATGRFDGRSHLPFGVFLAIGAAVTLFAGPALSTWYLGLL